MLSNTPRHLQLLEPAQLESVYLTEVDGVEGWSMPFHYRCRLHYRHASFNPEQLEGQPMACQIELNGQKKIIHGIINNIRHNYLAVRDWNVVDISLVPQLHSLHYCRKARVFTKMSTLAIIKQLFREHHYHDFDTSGLDKASLAHRELAQYEQYNETDAELLQRLLADSGLWYYYQHDSKAHRLHLAHDVRLLPTLSAAIELGSLKHGTDDAQHWQQQYQLGAADSGYLGATAMPSTQQQTSGWQHNQLQSGLYHYQRTAVSSDNARALARQDLLAANNDKQTINATSSDLRLTPGDRFNTAEQTSQCYAILQMKLYAYDASCLGNTDNEPVYRSQMTLLSGDDPWVPTQRAFTAIPTLQWAEVTAMDSASLHDASLPLSIQPQWVQTDQPSTINAQLLSIDAGRDHGMHLMPRVGHHVLIRRADNGNDTAAVVGSAYNGNALPPFDLPKHRYQSGLQTRSVGSKAKQQGNRIAFDESQNSESVQLKAQKEWQITAAHDIYQRTNGNVSEQTQGNHQVVADSVLIRLGQGLKHTSSGGATFTLDTNSITFEGSGHSAGTPGPSAGGNNDGAST